MTSEKEYKAAIKNGKYFAGQQLENIRFFIIVKQKLREHVNAFTNIVWGKSMTNGSVDTRTCVHMNTSLNSLKIILVFKFKEYL